MVSPQTFFGLPEGEALDILNVAANADQANTVFFDKLRQRVVRWKWLRDHYTVKISGIFLGQIKPEDFMNTIVVTKNGVLFPKNIRAFSGHSDESHQEGKNILCFVGDTLVSLVNGTNVPIKELVGKEPFYVYSYNGTKIVPGLAHSVHKTKEQADTVSVLLDNGQRVQCTPDHLFMLRDGSYKEAQYLVSGDSLMPLYRRYDRPELKDYELLYQPHVAHYQYTHRSFWASSTGSVRLQIPGHVIHHRNGNRRDNCPTNLALLTSQAHLDWHHSIHGKQHKIWWQNHPEHREKISKLFSNRIISTEHRAQLRALRLGKHLSEETKLRISVSTKGKHKSQQTRERMRAVIVTMKVDGRWQARGKKISQSLTGRVRSKEHCLKLSQGKRREIAALSPEQYYKRFATRCGASPSVETRQKISASLKHKWASKAVVNHKVISVTPAGQADVYDLTVDIYQNFALTAGVFVHNCFTLDESSAFDDSPTTNRAQKIFDMLKSSAVSRFGERFKGFVLSFPRYKDDFIMRLYKLAQGELHWFSDTGATWEIKPQHLFKDYPEKYFEFEGHKIPLEFESEFRHNPDDARGKYLCLPVEIEQAFIEYPDKIDLCVDAGRPPIAVVKDYVEEDKVKKSFNYFNNDLIYRDYVVTVDLGLRSDSAALSVFHKDFRIDGSYYVQDLAVTWVPNREKRLIVDLTNVEEFITTLSKQIHIIGVWFDQWNSALLSQRLTAAGLFSDIYRINFQDYKNMKDRLYEGHIRLLNFPTQISELKRLVLLRGGKVEHPVDGGKDAVDTIVGALKVLGEGGPGASSLVPSPLGGEIILGSNLTSEGGTFL
jgi:intein/homing endonuclease